MFESINFQICRKFIKLHTLSCSAIDIKMFHMFVGSKRLYELYKSAQQEADDCDEELDPDGSLGKTNSVLTILIQKVGLKCGIPSVIINHRLIQEYKTKIWRLIKHWPKPKLREAMG